MAGRENKDMPSTPDENHEMDVDVLAVSPPPAPHPILTAREKKYYCQRCLNHDQYHPRKGHKPHCKNAVCSCNNCSMVETRRQLNNKLKGPIGGKVEKKVAGEGKERTPNCARCSAHGIITALRGHKKTLCQFYLCDCEKCKLVCHRRDIMARQIKLRRNQQKARLFVRNGRQSTDSAYNTDYCSSSDDSSSPSPDLVLSESPAPQLLQPMPMRPLPMPIMPRLPPQPMFPFAAAALIPQWNLTQIFNNPALLEIARIMAQYGQQQQQPQQQNPDKQQP